MHEGPGSFKGQRAAYRTNLPQMVKPRATYSAHMPGKGQFLVQGHTQVPHSSGKQDTREAFQQDGKISALKLPQKPTKTANTTQVGVNTPRRTFLSRRCVYECL